MPHRRLAAAFASLLISAALAGQARADALKPLRLKMGATMDEVGKSGYGLLGVRGVDWSVPRESAAFAAYAASLDRRGKLRATAERRCAAEALRVDFPGAPADWGMNLAAAHLPPGANLERARGEIGAGRKPDPAKIERLFVSLWISSDAPEDRVLCLGFLDDRLAFVSVLTELTPQKDADAMRAALRKALGLGVNPLGAAAQQRVWVDRGAGLLIEDRPVFGVLIWSDRTRRAALVKALAEAWAK